MLLLASPMVIPILISRKLDYITYFFIRVWVRFLAYLQVSGLWATTKKLLTGRSLTSLLSTILLFWMRQQFQLLFLSLVALGKKELSKIPFFGWLTSKWAIWVDRSSPESRKEGSEKLKQILSGGTSVLVAPEGTRNNTDEPLLPFRYGPFRLAIESQIPILPVIIHNAGKLMTRGSLFTHPRNRSLLGPSRSSC